MFLKSLKNYDTNFICGISDNLLDKNVLNGKTSAWGDVNAGVPQGSTPGPLLFQVYINDLPGDLYSKAKLFADNATL